jgi:hypothetical protein
MELLVLQNAQQVTMKMMPQYVNHAQDIVKNVTDQLNTNVLNVRLDSIFNTIM